MNKNTNEGRKKEVNCCARHGQPPSGGQMLVSSHRNQSGPPASFSPHASSKETSSAAHSVVLPRFVSKYYLAWYSGFQAAVDSPEGKIFRFVRPVAKIFR